MLIHTWPDSCLREVTHFYVTWLFSLCPCGWRHGGKDYVSFAALVCLHSGEGEQLIYPRHDSFLWNLAGLIPTQHAVYGTMTVLKTMIACAGDKESNPFTRHITQSWKLGINIPEPSKANYMSLAPNSRQTWFLAATKDGEDTTMFAIVCHRPPTNESRSRTR